MLFTLMAKELTNDILPIFVVMLGASWIPEILRGSSSLDCGMKWWIVCMLCRAVGAKPSYYVLSVSTILILQKM